MKPVSVFVRSEDDHQREVDPGRDAPRRKELRVVAPTRERSVPTTVAQVRDGNRRTEGRRPTRRPGSRRR